MSHPKQSGPRRAAFRGRKRSGADARASLLRASLLLAALLLASLLPLPLAAQVTADPTVAADTAPEPLAEGEARSAARSAQGRFERLRRQWSPPRHHPWLGSDCDEVVGRICLSYFSGGDWWPGPEDPRIEEAREELLLTLAAATEASPSDPWILGQRVNYLGEAGRWEEAEAVARACLPAAPDWCGTLLGFALHGQGRFVEAEEAFRLAIAAMDEDGRRRWSDPRVLLDDDGYRYLSGVGAQGSAERAEAVERIWRLADPLHLVEGNDRLTEHWARLTMARMRENATNPYGLLWGRDLEEVLVRYGWEVGWDRTLDFSGGLGGGMVGHHHPEIRRYLPPGSVVRDPSLLRAEEWTLSSVRPREGYAPPYAPVIIPADGEVLRFPRGDHMVVVGAYALPEDTSHHARHPHPPFRPPPRLRDEPVRSGLFLVPVGAGEAVQTSSSGAEEGAFMLEAAPGRYVASLEVWSPEQGLAGRLREGVRVHLLPPDAASLSDLALLQGPLPDSATLEDALPLLRPTGPVPGGTALVVAWEVHGLGWRAEVLSYRLTLARSDRGLLHRFGDWLGLTAPEEPVSLEWEEGAPDRPGPSLRSVSLELPDLDPGSYQLQLALSVGERELLDSQRTLTVVRPSR